MNFQILQGAPALVIGDHIQIAAARTLFGDRCTLLEDLPPLDDEDAWSKLRNRPLYLRSGPSAGRQADRAKLQGCDRIAEIDLPEDLCEGLPPGTSAKDILSAAREVAARHATRADLSIVEFPGTRPSPIPFAVLGPLEDAVRASAAHGSAHPDMAALAAMAVISGITSGSVTACVSEGHSQDAILYAAIIGSPGSNKTGALNIFEKAIASVERSLAREHAADMALHDAQNAEVPVRQRPEAPVREIVRLTDYTAEAAMFTLHRNGRGIMGLIPEMSAALPHLGLMPGAGYTAAGSLAALWLSAYDGGRRDYVRRSAGDDPKVIENLAMPLLTAAQPDVFADVLSSPRRDGLADRFLVAFPDLQIGSERNTEKPCMPFDTAQARLAEALRKLRGAVRDLEKADPISGEMRVRVPFSDRAQETYRIWSRRLMAKARYLDDAAAGARIKATSAFVRVAALSAFVRHVLAGEELIVSSICAIEAADYVDAVLDHRHKAEILALEPLRERRARALARAACLRQADMATPSEIRREWRVPAVRTEEDLRDALIELAALGWLEHETIRRGSRDSLPRAIRFNPEAIRMGRRLMN